MEIAGSDTRADPSRCGSIERDTRGEELKRNQYGSGSSVYMLHTGHWCKIEKREDAMRVCEVLRGAIY